MKCRTIRPPEKKGCGAPAKYRVTFSDGDHVLACEDCKMYFEQLAAEHHTVLKTKKLEEVKA